MMERVPDCVLIREEELWVLLAGLGYESVSGLFCRQTREPQVVQVLRELTDQRQIWSDGERFHVSQPLERMLRGIGDARRILTIRTREEEQGLCCYCGSALILCRELDWQPSMLRLRAAEAEEIVRMLAEKTASVYAHEEEAAPSGEQLWTEHAAQVLELRCYVDGALVRRLEGVWGVLQPPELLLSWPDGTRTALPWTRENLSAQVRQLLDG